MTDSVIEQHLVKLLRNFDCHTYIDYASKIASIKSNYDSDAGTDEISIINSADSAGAIGFRIKFKIPTYILLSHPICRFRAQRSYPLREPFFVASLGLVPIFFASLNRIAILKLWGQRAEEFFSPSSAPLSEDDSVLLGIPPALLEYSSMNFIEQNKSRAGGCRPDLTRLFNKYFSMLYWPLPKPGFSGSAHFLYDRERINSFLKVAKSLYLVEAIESPQNLLIEGKTVEARRVMVKALAEKNGRYFFTHFPVLMDADLANEVMVRDNPDSSFINGTMTEIRQSGGRRNSVLTIRADYALSKYHIVQALIGMVSARRFNRINEIADIGEIDEIREDVGNIFIDIKRELNLSLTFSDMMDDLYETSLSYMFPLLLREGRRVKLIHPLVWSFMKANGLIRGENDSEQQRKSLSLLVRLVESNKSFPALSLSPDSDDLFTKNGINKREGLKISAISKKTHTQLEND